MPATPGAGAAEAIAAAAETTAAAAGAVAAAEAVAAAGAVRSAVPRGPLELAQRARQAFGREQAFGAGPVARIDDQGEPHTRGAAIGRVQVPLPSHVDRRLDVLLDLPLERGRALLRIDRPAGDPHRDRDRCRRVRE